MKLSRDAWLVLVLFLLFSAVTFVSLRNTPQSQEPEKRPHYTSYSSKRSGTKAFFTLLKRLGYRPERAVDDPDSVPPAAGLLIVEKPTRGYPSFRGRLGRWLRSGGCAIVFLGGEESFQGLGIEASKRAGGRKAFRLRVEPAYAAGVRRLDLRSGDRLYAEQGWSVIAGDSQGVIAAEKPIGKGRIIVVSDPWIASNSEIGKSDNAVFLVNLISARVNKGEAVVFDEYSQGYAVPKTPLGVLPHAWKFALVQIALAALLAVYSAGRRFGSVNAAVEGRSRRPAHEYVQAMGRLYRKADAGRAAFEIIYDAFWADLCVRLSIPADSSDRDAIAATEGMTGADSTDLLHLIERRRGDEPISQSELVRLAGTICSLRKETGIDR
ncbi:MAG: DUF4350 domain-containing protein [Armatimonadota bacterium]|nr:DUF4350 domain-containing protein [Armatimonadota bacterium]